MTRKTVLNGAWFNEDSATKFNGIRVFDGANFVCPHSGNQWGGSALFYTRSGNWVQNTWVNAGNISDDYNQIDEDAAIQWLIRNDEYKPEGLPAKVAKRVNEAIESREI